MASSWSSLKIELLETGANSGTWGTLTNVNLGDAVLGEAITGSATVDFATDADVTITLTDSATTQSARNLRLNITESSTGVGSVRSLILGSGCQIEKFYLINNTGTGAKTVKNTSGTGISVPAGKATLVYNNGTNVVDAATYFTALTLGSALPVASGGTGLASGTSGGVLAYTATGTLASSTALAASALVIGGGAGAAPSTTTTGTGVVTALGVNTGTAGAFVVNGGALGSPSSVGTMPAFTLGGTVSGGGNQINNVVIGTTTPLAGSFTTLTTSSTVTHNGGTANGVGYLNASKVLTTGSALTYNGTSFGVGSSDYGNAGAINLSVGVAGTTAGGVQLWSNTTNAHSIQWGDGTTSSDPYRGAIEYAHTGDSMRFYTSATERMRLDSAGNLGLGVTPSAWGSQFKAMQIGSGATKYASFGQRINSTGDLFLSWNAFNDSTGTAGSNGWKYTVGGDASTLYLVGGAHTWFTAPAGATAGDPITFTQAMTLGSTGDLILGGTDTSVGKMVVKYTSNGTTPTSPAQAGLNLWGDSSVRLLFGTYSGSPYAAYIQTSNTGSPSVFPLVLNPDGGNVGIGTTSPAQSLDTTGKIRVRDGGNTTVPSIQMGSTGVDGFSLPSTNTIAFITNSLERARIDSSGNLLVGATSAVLSGKLTTSFTGNTINGATFDDTGNGNGAGFIIFSESGTAIGSVSRVASTSAVAFNTTSDYRLKTVTGTVTGQGTRIDALNPVDYLWTEGGQQARGFLAHEFQTVYPNSVTGDKDAVDADGNPKHQSMQASSSEVIADLVAELQSLRARVAQLESKP